MKKTLLSLAMTAMLSLGSASAFAEFLDFKVNEGVVDPGNTLPNIFTADKLNGGYTEFLAPTSATTFATSAVGNLGQFFKNEGTALVSSQLNGFGNGGYGLYAIFTASGNITGANLFQGTSGGFSLYLDRNKDTTFNGFFASNDPVSTPLRDAGTFGDDDLLASTFTVVSGSGNLNGPPGAFDITFKDFTLTAVGATYFFDPNPFHMIVQINGDYDQFVPTSTPFVSRVTGDVSAVFQIPEPGSLALFGLALAGLGLTQRRRKSVQ